MRHGDQLDRERGETGSGIRQVEECDRERC